MISMRILAIITFCSVPIVSQEMEECDKDDRFPFYRMLVIQGYWPPPTSKVDGDILRMAWGSCVDHDETVVEMIRYVQSFGFDVRALQENPYSLYNDTNYSVRPIFSNDFKILMTSLFDVSKFLNHRIFYAGWAIRTNRDIDGPNGTVPAGSYIAFSIHRFKLHGRDFCLRYTRRDWTPPRMPEQRLVPMEYVVYSKEWGRGSSRGIGTQLSNIEIRLVTTFPGDE